MTTRVLFFLLLTLAAGAADPVPPAGMAYVPAGEFTMGSDEGNFDERPAHRVQLSAYFIDRHEVTVDEYNAYIRATDRFDVIEGPWFRISTAACVDLLARYEQRYGTVFADFRPAVIGERAAAERLTRDALQWKAAVAALRVLLGADRALADGTAAGLRAAPAVQARIASEGRLPVTFVTWRDASAYARWAGKRLPTEAEWEKAARGPDRRVYPWGNEWDPARARAGLDVDAGPVAVGQFPLGASPYGCLDMAGNVWEWCEDWFGESYYQECADGIVNPRGPVGLANGELPAPDPKANYLQNASKQGREPDTRKIVRGGCWAAGAGMIGQTEFNNRSARRLWSNPDYWSQDTGFRCAQDAP
jgi:formylglycine-generating enzyme